MLQFVQRLAISDKGIFGPSLSPIFEFFDDSTQNFSILIVAPRPYTRHTKRPASHPSHARKSKEFIVRNPQASCRRPVPRPATTSSGPDEETTWTDFSRSKHS
jgi:hypothetical protein